jgi:hypothetical protein
MTKFVLIDNGKIVGMFNIRACAEVYQLARPNSVIQEVIL